MAERLKICLIVQLCSIAISPHKVNAFGPDIPLWSAKPPDWISPEKQKPFG
ncbi:hypothetical protein [Acutalibacter sp. JLR.KK004]|uniref:hypothetical protein n=1 Tax=Acutalibacter sp. JLR.KK004 TaxID=3112622 RepID=UPI002FF3A20D